jgi:hypothetical protein
VVAVVLLGTPEQMLLTAETPVYPAVLIYSFREAQTGIMERVMAPQAGLVDYAADPLSHQEPYLLEAEYHSMQTAQFLLLVPF